MIDRIYIDPKVTHTRNTPFLQLQQRHIQQPIIPAVPLVLVPIQMRTGRRSPTLQNEEEYKIGSLNGIIVSVERVMLITTINAD